MTARAEDDPPPEAGRLPTGRLARTARVGGLVTGQGLRWAGMRTANRVRSSERAAAARDERTAALVGELVDQLSRMRGAAMKVGQLFSMIELDGLPAEQRAALQSRLATLRDDVPPVPFRRLERLMRDELGAPLGRVFASFDERALAAASIGQVHRATTLDGDERVFRGHPFITVPRVRSDLSTTRVLVSEYVEGERFEAVRARDQAQRDRYGEIVFRFYFGLLYRNRIALGDPHPGNYLLCPDGRVAFLDYGLVRDLGAGRIEAERAIALAVREDDPAALKG